MAAVIGIPVGLGAGVFVAEMAGPRMASIVRFTADVLTGVPSIVVGIVVYSWLVLKMGHFSALAAARRPGRHHAAYHGSLQRGDAEAGAAVAAGGGLGAGRDTLADDPQHRHPSGARRGLITGGLLAVARAAGETAPLLFTALGNQFMTFSLFGKPIDALPLRIYQYGTGPYNSQHEQAWAAAFVLVTVVFCISLTSRLLLSRRG